jgi:phosphopantetheinyl transferase
MMQAAAAVRRVAAVHTTAPASLDWMSPGERARAARIRAAPRHAQYLAGHWLLRQLLAHAFAGDPRDYALIERENLPPAVDGSRVHVSLSHGGDWIAAAWSLAPIGIDLEPRESRPALGRLRHLLLNADEVIHDIDNDALLQRWVLKEALIKRDLGQALPGQLAALQLHPAPGNVADVELVSTDDWHLALSPIGVEIDADSRPHTRSRWQVSKA